MLAIYVKLTISGVSRVGAVEVSIFWIRNKVSGGVLKYIQINLPGCSPQLESFYSPSRLVSVHWGAWVFDALTNSVSQRDERKIYLQKLSVLQRSLTCFYRSSNCWKRLQTEFDRFPKLCQGRGRMVDIWRVWCWWWIVGQEIVHWRGNAAIFGQWMTQRIREGHFFRTRSSYQE